MRYFFKFGLLSLALGFIFVSADTANAQNRRGAQREYRQDIQKHVEITGRTSVRATAGGAPSGIIVAI